MMYYCYWHDDDSMDCYIIYLQIHPPPLPPTDVPPIPTETTTSDSSNITTPAPIIDFTPDITPCENRYIYKIYRHTQSGHDVMALQNLETNMVTIYNWTTVVGPEGPTVNREYSEVDNAEFLSDEMYTSYFHFVGWTIESKNA